MLSHYNIRKTYHRLYKDGADRVISLRGSDVSVTSCFYENPWLFRAGPLANSSNVYRVHLRNNAKKCTARQQNLVYKQYKKHNGTMGSKMRIAIMLVACSSYIRASCCRNLLGRQFYYMVAVAKNSDCFSQSCCVWFVLWFVLEGLGLADLS